MNATMESVTAFAPATVSNVGCGFDVLGFALDHPGDEVTARFLSGSAPGVPIEGIQGGDAGGGGGCVGGCCVWGGGGGALGGGWWGAGWKASGSVPDRRMPIISRP